MTHSDFRFMRTLCIACLLPALCMAALGGAVTIAEAAIPQVKVACFSASDWNGNDQNRPCTTVVRPDNDQVVVIQGTASREQSACVISTSAINDATCYRINHNRAMPDTQPHWSGVQHRYVNGPAAVCNIMHQCAAIGRPNEDGSNFVTVYDYSEPIERCILSNPVEEPSHYTVPCEAA